ncbi:MAG TPA: hypothetical protein PLZ57_00130 [Pseudobdellovibrionaceae bacterium]|nr:hypothetical protein [Pseudobdellovibrionaceae bacterium]
MRSRMWKVRLPKFAEFAVIAALGISFAFITEPVTASEPAPAAAAEGQAATPSAAPIAAPKCRIMDHMALMSSLRSKIGSMEREIHDQMKAFEKAKHQPDQTHEHSKLIALKYKDLQRLVREHRELELHIRFRHPDRHDESTRQYQAVRLKTLEEIRTSFGIDGRLDRIKKQVEVVLPVPKQDSPAQRAPASVAAPRPDEEELPERIHLIK